MLDHRVSSARAEPALVSLVQGTERLAYNLSIADRLERQRKGSPQFLNASSQKQLTVKVILTMGKSEYMRARERTGLLPFWSSSTLEAGGWRMEILLECFWRNWGKGLKTFWKIKVFHLHHLLVLSALPFEYVIVSLVGQFGSSRRICLNQPSQAIFYFLIPTVYSSCILELLMSPECGLPFPFSFFDMLVCLQV